MAAVGDSITAGFPAWDPSPGFRGQLPDRPDPRSQYTFWARRHLGPRFRFTNCGVSGDRTDQIRQRFDGCVEEAEVVIVQGGLNDLAYDRRVPEVAGNLREMVRRGRERGLRVLIAELLPVAGDDGAFGGRIVALNRAIHRIAREEGVRVLRWYRILEDRDEPGVLDARLSEDGIHPTIEGYRKLGEAVELP